MNRRHLLRSIAGAAAATPFIVFSSASQAEASAAPEVAFPEGYSLISNKHLTELYAERESQYDAGYVQALQDAGVDHEVSWDFATGKQVHTYRHREAEALVNKARNEAWNAAAEAISRDLKTAAEACGLSGEIDKLMTEKSFHNLLLAFYKQGKMAGVLEEYKDIINLPKGFTFEYTPN